MRNLLVAPLLLAVSTLVSMGASAQWPGRASSSLEPDSAQQRPLPLEQAFPWFLNAAGDGFDVIWTPAPGHYLYRHAFAFSLVEREGAEPTGLAFTLPRGSTKSDPFFGDVEAYYGQVRAMLHWPAPPATGSGLLIEYQGCADWGFCYPPQRVLYPLRGVLSMEQGTAVPIAAIALPFSGKMRVKSSIGR